MNLKFPISLVGKSGSSIPDNISLMPVYYADLDDATGTTQIGPTNLNPVTSSGTGTITANPTGAPDGQGSSILSATAGFNRGGYAHEVGMGNVTAYSVSCWFKADQVLGSGFTRGQRVAYWGKINQENFQFFAGNSTGDILSYQPRKTKQNEPAIPYGSMDAGEWYHVVATWDYTEYKFYVNGVLIDTKPTTINSLWLGSGALWIGRDTYNDTRYNFAGEVAMFGLWREVITSDDVLYMYNGGMGRRFSNITV
jgi:hypothetical protein